MAVVLQEHLPDGFEIISQTEKRVFFRGTEQERLVQKFRRKLNIAMRIRQEKAAMNTPSLCRQEARPDRGRAS